MTIARGFGFGGLGGLGETHLMPDAIVAFVDDELSNTAEHRARAHLSRCAVCAAEAAAQRQARNEVRALDAPGIPARLMAALQDIPFDTDVPAVPDGLAVTSDGQLVAVQRPDRAAALLGEGGTLGATPPIGAGRMLGDSAPLGNRPLGRASGGRSREHGEQKETGDQAGPTHPVGRRAAQGAGALVSGLMLGALTLGSPLTAQAPAHPRPAGPPARTQQAGFAVAPRPSAPRTDNTANTDNTENNGDRDHRGTAPLVGTVPAGR